MSENCSPDEIDLEVMGCSIRRLSTKEALEHLHGRGFKIEERSFYARKKKLKEINIKRVTSGIQDLVTQHFRMIDSLELIQKNLWKDLDNVKDANIRLKIMNAIRDNQKYLLEYYGAIPALVDSQIDNFKRLGYAERIDYTNYKICNIKRRLEKDDQDPFEYSQILTQQLSEETKKKLNDELKELESKNQKIPQNYDDFLKCS